MPKVKSDYVPAHKHDFETRLGFVKSLVANTFEFEGSLGIEPVAYDLHDPEKNVDEPNNFVYKVWLNGECYFKLREQTVQFGCVPMPPETSLVIVRLANQRALGMNRYNRIENEVACLQIAADALKESKPQIVPSVYAWKSGAQKDSQGWIVQEFKLGERPDVDLMEEPARRDVLRELAEIVNALQNYPLPLGVTGCGGLTFDENGAIVSCREPGYDAGPWATFEEAVKERLRITLNNVTKNQVIRGWYERNIRLGLEQLIDEVPARLEMIPDKDSICLVHCDLNDQNILHQSGHVTALLDFDFAHISHPLEEYLRSFRGVGGVFRSTMDVETEEDLAILIGKKTGNFPESLPRDVKNHAIRLAEHLERAFEGEQGLKYPRNMPGIDVAADIDSFLEKIEPWRLTNPRLIEREEYQSEKTRNAYRAKCEKDLLRMLDILGIRLPEVEEPGASKPEDINSQTVDKSDAQKAGEHL